MGDRRNAKRVLAAAPALARRLRETDVTLGTLTRELRASYPTLLSALLTQMGRREYRRLMLLRLRRGGNGTQFAKGHIAWNKGRKGLCCPGSRPTQFKRGCLRGQAARNWRPVGTIVIRFDRPPKRTRGRKNARPGAPRRWIKVREDGPAVRYWEPWARYLWRQRYGPIPPGGLIGHIDGDALNDALDNLALMTRAENLRRLGTIRPKAVQRRAVAAAKANRKRRRDAAHLRARGPIRTTYECVGCGASLAKPPAPCPKCGGFTCEIVRRRSGEAVRVVGEEEGGPE
ncbi:MAG TPA: HNH endonuclease signature motif containing protein [Phycisphaerae bacterium]|nr:HNH endonuclease signature motif containing protein [Phycisphaerae bacterium]